MKKYKYKLKKGEKWLDWNKFVKNNIKEQKRIKKYGYPKCPYLEGPNCPW